mgnify:CR=1 FL=1
MDADLAAQRLCRLRSVMCDTAVEFVLTVDPINITYATGLWNMNVFSMMGATWFLLIAVERMDHEITDALRAAGFDPTFDSPK